MRSTQKFWILYFTVILQPRVKEHLKDNPIISYMEQFMSMLEAYFNKRGFEDPFLEMLTFSTMIEGYGVLLVYIYPNEEIPKETIRKFEDRMIEMFTRK